MKNNRGSVFNSRLVFIMLLPSCNNIEINGLILLDCRLSCFHFYGRSILCAIAVASIRSSVCPSLSKN